MAVHVPGTLEYDQPRADSLLRLKQAERTLLKLARAHQGHVTRRVLQEPGLLWAVATDVDSGDNAMALGAVGARVLTQLSGPPQFRSPETKREMQLTADVATQLGIEPATLRLRALTSPRLQGTAWEKFTHALTTLSAKARAWDFYIDELHEASHSAAGLPGTAVPKEGQLHAPESVSVAEPSHAAGLLLRTEPSPERDGFVVARSLLPHDQRLHETALRHSRHCPPMASEARLGLRDRRDTVAVQQFFEDAGRPGLGHPLADKLYSALLLLAANPSPSALAAIGEYESAAREVMALTGASSVAEARSALRSSLVANSNPVTHRRVEIPAGLPGGGRRR